MIRVRSNFTPDTKIEVKHLDKGWFYLIIGLVMIGILGCLNRENSSSDFDQSLSNTGKVSSKIQEDFYMTEAGHIVPEKARKAIENTLDNVIEAITQKDFQKVALFVHPEKGVRFTPYTYVVPQSDIVLQKDQIANFFQDETRYLWGYFDGTGDEIRLTPSEYYKRFIYSQDFLNAEKIGYNEVLSFGNMLENQFEIYLRPIIVEYYFSGFNPDYGGMDWRSLRLVFEEYEGIWKLVGIIHNEWTI